MAVAGTMVVNRVRRSLLGQILEGPNGDPMSNAAAIAEAIVSANIDAAVHLLSALEFIRNLRMKSLSAVTDLRTVAKGMGERPDLFSAKDREDLFNLLGILEDIYNGTDSFLNGSFTSNYGSTRWVLVSHMIARSLNDRGISLYIERWIGPGLRFEEVPFIARKEQFSRFISSGARTSLLEDFQHIAENQKAIKEEASKAGVSLGWVMSVTRLFQIIKTLGVPALRFILGRGFIESVVANGLAKALFSAQGARAIGGVIVMFSIPSLIQAVVPKLTETAKGIVSIPKGVTDSVTELLAGARQVAFPVGTAIMIGGGALILLGGYFIIRSWQ